VISCVPSESLRVYPPFPFVTKIVHREHVIGAGSKHYPNGIHMPEGVHVMIDSLALHRNPELWPEPDRFNPARFLSDDPALSQRSEKVLQAHLLSCDGCGACGHGIRLAYLQFDSLVTADEFRASLSAASTSSYHSARASDGVWANSLP